MKPELNKRYFMSSIAGLGSKPAARKRPARSARCNLCDKSFRAASSFHRFCQACRSEDELFKFAEWLPQS